MGFTPSITPCGTRGYLSEYLMRNIKSVSPEFAPITAIMSAQGLILLFPSSEVSTGLVAIRRNTLIGQKS